MNMISPKFRALLFSFLCTTTLWGMEDGAADATGLEDLVSEYNDKSDFLTRKAWVEKIITYKKNAFIALDQQKYEKVSTAITTLQDGINSEIYSYELKLQKRPFRRHIWGYGA